MDGPRQKRRIAIRTTLTTTFMLVAYFAAPLNRSFTLRSAAALVVALLALGALVAWQAHAIIRSPFPRLRTVEALATSVPLFLLLFAASYCLLANDTPPGFSEPLTHVDALYFTVTVFATVGFGDIVPRTQTARALTTIQMIVDLIVLGLVVKVFLEAMRRGVTRHPPDESAER
ncbi:ion channel [Actinomadura pelletieri DSM 43383]|uniref:Ion channel n=1 Tax=Actinomadura pelletieri DSM 43383 TaxID=1120940 RepID=A0A495QXR8_9ACTN|nr:potassium channel family protein [Actinomadura pelletieri]RKS78999.1 ion channel [Actinomadura pelletieri DSM 43383]